MTNFIKLPAWADEQHINAVVEKEARYCARDLLAVMCRSIGASAWATRAA
jgi:hypothetical protein